MFDPCRLRTAVPLTFLAVSACGVAPQSGVADAADAREAPAAGRAVARLADGGASTCPSGGNVLKYGIDKNGNGKLDDNEVLGTFDICNGTSGTLTKISNVAPGAQCSQGGVLVATGPDTNGNGTLDDAEVATSLPICGTGGQITTVLGSITISSNADLARYASTETVSGYIYFSLTGINGTVTLPKLRGVGMDLYASTNGGGPGLFNLDQAERARAKRQAAHRRYALNSPIPTNRVTLNLPALQSVGGQLSLDEDIKVQAPALTTVGDDLYCYDPNATFPALVSLGELDTYECGDANVIMANLTFYGSSYGNSPNSFVNNKLASVGVRTSYGYTDFENGTFYLSNPRNTNTSLPNLTQVGRLEIGGVYADNANLTLPALTSVSTLNLRADDLYDFALPIGIHPYAHIVLSNFSVRGYAVEQTRSENGGYNGILAKLVNVGGAFQVVHSSLQATNANNLVTAGGVGFWDNQDATQLSMPKLTAVAPADPNFDICYGDQLGDDNLVYCDADNPNTLKASASIVIQNNGNLASVDFGNVNSVAGGLYIQGNGALTNVSGLSHLTKLGATNHISAVGRSLTSSLLIESTGLANLAAFGSITSAPGVTGIAYNDNLTDISALHLSGSADTCPLVLQNPQLPYCKVQQWLQSYNTDCTMSGTASQMGLRDPCDPNPCSGGTSNCVPNCDPTSQTGYDCN